MNRRILWMSVFALGITMLVGDVVQAQQERSQRGQGEGRRRGPGGFGGFSRFSSPVSLLGNEEVQKELGLNAKQKEDAKKLSEDYRADQRASFTRPDSGSRRGSSENLSEEERNKRRDEFFKRMEESRKKLNAKYEPKVADLLDPPQAERLDQISLQTKGVGALQEKETSEVLGLSKEQLEKITSINQAHREKMREMFSSFGRGQRGGGDKGGDRGARGGDRGGFSQLREIGEKRDADVLAVLTDAQKKTFADMKGKIVAPEKLRSRFGGGLRRGGDRGKQRPST